MSKHHSGRRTRARQRALQALYQWDLSGTDATEISAQFLAEQDMGRVDIDYFNRLLQGVVDSVEVIGQTLEPLLDRALSEVDPVERSILRMGVYELQHQPDVPVRVIINESIELAKRFGAEQGYKYVNAAMDRAAHALRETELGASG